MNSAQININIETVKIIAGLVTTMVKDAVNSNDATIFSMIDALTQSISIKLVWLVM